MSGRHRFRFFVDAVGAAGATVTLAPADARHLAVLRRSDGDRVEIVDRDGTTWDAVIRGGDVELVERLQPHGELRAIELYAGALTGAKFDELVDGAVQAGAGAVVPVVATRREHDRLASRRPRLERISRAAAKQAKRSTVPVIGEPTMLDGLPDGGIVLDPAAPETLDRVLAAVEPGPVRLLVGGADGLDHEAVDALVGRGWQRARLGPTVLRAELAAAVAVGIAAMSDG